MGESFNVGGEDMMHPHDEDASGFNVINCRCSMTYRDVTVPDEGFAPSGEELPALAEGPEIIKTESPVPDASTMSVTKLKEWARTEEYQAVPDWREQSRIDEGIDTKLYRKSANSINKYGLQEGEPKTVVDALKEYTTNTYDNVNTYLRLGEIAYAEKYSPEWAADVKKEVVKIDKAFDSGEIQKYDGNVYRGQRFDYLEQATQFIDDLKTEGYYTSDQYLSTTTDFKDALKFAKDFRQGVLVVVEDATGGLALGNISAYGTEDEVLLNRGKRYQVTKIVEDENRIKLYEQFAERAKGPEGIPEPTYGDWPKAPLATIYIKEVPELIQTTLPEKLSKTAVEGISKLEQIIKEESTAATTESAKVLEWALKNDVFVNVHAPLAKWSDASVLKDIVESVSKYQKVSDIGILDNLSYTLAPGTIMAGGKHPITGLLELNIGESVLTRDAMDKAWLDEKMSDSVTGGHFSATGNFTKGDFVTSSTLHELGHIKEVLSGKAFVNAWDDLVINLIKDKGMDALKSISNYAQTDYEGTKFEARYGRFAEAFAESHSIWTGGHAELLPVEVQDFMKENDIPYEVTKLTVEKRLKAQVKKEEEKKKEYIWRAKAS
jgi:hypothetical protein